MRTLFSISLFTAALLLSGCASCGNWQCPAIGNAQVLRHVVLVDFKDGVSDEKIAEVEAGFAALPDQIDVIKGFEWGTNVSVENLDHGYTHCFLVTFADEAGRDAYLPHPAHKEFVELLKPTVEKVLVLDYVPGE